MVRRLSLLLSIFTSIALLVSSADAQKAQQPKSNKSVNTRSTIQARSAAVFQPTCNLDSTSVGFYFFPANLGAKWTMRTVQQVFDNQSKLVKSDTFYSYERIVSDSDRTLQGAPILTCESSAPFREGGEAAAKTQQVQYYLDDSVVMAVFNHSLTSTLSRFMLVNPLSVGGHWHEKAEDSAVAEIVSMHEPVTVPAGEWNNAMVVRTAVSFGELSRYYVPGVGLVKSVFRGIPQVAAQSAPSAFVMTTELVKLDRGDETRSVRKRFAQAQAQIATQRAAEHQAPKEIGRQKPTVAQKPSGK